MWAFIQMMLAASYDCFLSQKKCPHLLVWFDLNAGNMFFFVNILFNDICKHSPYFKLQLLIIFWFFFFVCLAFSKFDTYNEIPTINWNERQLP